MLPPPPYGSASKSGTRPSSSAISNAAVFCPSMRNGFSELTSTYRPESPSARAARSVSSNVPRTATSRAPTALACASFPSATAPAGSRISAVSPARAAYAAADAAVLPVDAHTTPVAPSATARDTATVIPRSLNDPVGFMLSSFSQRSTPSSLDSASACTSGVEPSYNDTTGSSAPIGKRER